MESLLLRGKAPITEDALTAALADLLEDLDDQALVNGILSRIRAVAEEGRLSPKGLVGIPAFDAFQLRLWPSWAPWGEPDLLLTLDQGGLPVAAIAIEFKYESTKSGRDTKEDDSLKDQLGRYAAALEEKFPNAIKNVVYLTGSSVPPTSELANSWLSICKKTGLKPAQTLRWLSWRDVDRVVRDRLKTMQPDSVSWRRTARVLALLERAGLRCFDGWLAGQLPPPLQPPPVAIAHWLKFPGRWRTELAPDVSLSPRPSHTSNAGYWMTSA